MIQPNESARTPTLSDGSPAGNCSGQIRFDARDVLLGKLDDVTVEQAVLA